MFVQPAKPATNYYCQWLHSTECHCFPAKRRRRHCAVCADQLELLNAQACINRAARMTRTGRTVTSGRADQQQLLALASGSSRHPLADRIDMEPEDPKQLR